jgi:hypothetical protein
MIGYCETIPAVLEAATDMAEKGHFGEYKNFFTIL